MGFCYQYDCDILLQKGGNKGLKKNKKIMICTHSHNIGEAIFLIGRTCSTRGLNSYGVRLGASSDYAVEAGKFLAS